MRPHKSSILIALVVLLLTAFVAVMAQTPAQSGDQKMKTESCCAMDSCCCNDGSCPMMKNEGTTANADATTASADVKHDCCADSCNMNKDGATENSANAADCCSSGSCDMAHHAKHAKHDKKTHAADGSCCKAKNKDAKQKDAKEKTK